MSFQTPRQDFDSFFASCEISKDADTPMPLTHTCIQLCPGSASVSWENQELFKKLFLEAVRTGLFKGAIVERRTGMSHAFLLYDIDLNMPGAARVYTMEHIKRFVTEVVKVLKEHVVLPEERIQAVITEKLNPSRVKNTSNTKDGFHVYFPDVITTFDVQFAIRSQLVSRMAAIFEGISPINKNGWEDVLDRCVIKTNGMVLPGTRKPDGQHYYVTAAFLLETSGEIVQEEFFQPPTKAKQQAQFCYEMHQRFDLFQRSRHDWQPLQPTSKCTQIIEFLHKVQVADKSKNQPGPGRPPKPDVPDVPMEDTGADTLVALPRYQEVEQAVMFLAPYRSQDYTTWYSTGFALSSLVRDVESYNQYSKLFIEFSRVAPNFAGEQETETKFKKLRQAWQERRSVPDASVITFRSIFSWVRQIIDAKGTSEDVRATGKVLISKYRASSYMEEMLDLVAPIPLHLLQVFDFNDPEDPRCRPFHWNHERELIVVRAPMGSGKTFQEIDFIKRHASASTLLFGTRRAFSKNVVDRFNRVGIDITSYLNKSADIDACNKLMISVESLHRLGKEDWEVVIIDECEAFASQCLADTVKYLPQAYAKLSTILKNAACVVLLDAFVTRRSLEFIRRHIPEHHVTLYRNHVQPTPREFRFIAPKNCRDPGLVTLAMFRKLADLLRVGENVVFPSASKRMCDAFLRYMQKHESSLWQTVMETGGYRYYSTDTPEDELFADIQNIEMVWKGLRLLMFTGKISVGVDFSVPDIFHTVVVYGSASSGQTGVDLLQQAFRVRHTKSNAIFVYASCAVTKWLPLGTARIRAESSTKIEALSKMFEQHRLKLLDERQPALNEALLRAMESNGGNLSKGEYERLYASYLSEIDAMRLQAIPEPLRGLHEDESNLRAFWSTFYAPMFVETVEEMGHSIVIDDSPLDLEELRAPGVDLTELIDEDDEDEQGVYSSIAAIDKAWYLCLVHKKKRGETTAAEVLQIKKYEFDEAVDKFPIQVTPDKRARIFVKVMRDKRLESIFNNILCEFQSQKSLLTDIVTKRPYGEIVDSTRAAVGLIRDICRLLGIRHTLDADTVVCRQTIMDNAQELFAKTCEVMRLLHIRDQGKKGQEITFDKLKSRLDNVLGNWSGVKLGNPVIDAHTREIQSVNIVSKDTVAAGISKILFSKNDDDSLAEGLGALQK